MTSKLSEILQYLAKPELAERVFALQSALTSYRAIGPTNISANEEAKGELAKILFVTETLAKAGVSDLRRFDAKDSRVVSGIRPNLIAKVPGQPVKGQQAKTLWILVHADVVPVGQGWTSDPWTVRRDGDLLYGRGVEDNQQALVSALLLFEALNAVKAIPEHNLGLIVVSDEETGNTFGAKYLLEQAEHIFQADDFFLVPDAGMPGGLDIEIAEKTTLHLQVKIQGQQGHAALPHLAKNATLIAATAIVELSQALKENFAQENELFKPAYSTFTPTQYLDAGLAINVIPAQATFSLDCRILPEIAPEAVLHFVQAKAKELAQKFAVDINVEQLFCQKASATSKDSPIVQALAKAISQVYGKDAKLMGVGGGTVAALLRYRGLPAAVWSNILNTCHKQDECSSISATIKDAEVMAHLLFAN